jgi:glycerol-3-phosphate acyltransferase PlsX
MKIALDAMGGDHAPAANVEGAIQALNESDDIQVTLVGDEQSIRKELSGKSCPDERIEVLHASEVITMDDSPSMAVRRKKDSSLRRAVELVKDRKAEAAVSAGNSGAMMALAMFLVGSSKGVDRPAIATIMPSIKEPFLLLDAGANVDCNAENLLHFALMGDAYCRQVMNRTSPRVAVLSIGEEPKKGNELTKEAFKLISKSGLNFKGNIESKDVFMGEADVVVCDGFVGNIFLKTSEGIADVLMRMLKKEISISVLGTLGYLMMTTALRNFKKKTDYDEYGGAPLLGIDGSCIISHGRSTPKAIKNAIIKAADFSRKKVYETISIEIQKSKKKEKTVAAG